MNGRAKPEPAPEKPRGSMMARGVRLFLACSLIGWAVIYVMADGARETLAILMRIDGALAAVFLLLTLAGYFLGGLRTWYIARHALGKRVAYSGCLKADLANIFVGQLTPMQSGAGPAQLYMLHRAGLQLGDAMAVSLINMTFSLLLIFSVTGMLVVSGDSAVTSGKLGFFLRYSFWFLGVLCVIAAAVRLRPALLLAAVRRIVDRLRPGSGVMLDLLAERFVRHLRLLWENVVYFWRRRPLHVLGGLLMTALVYGNKFVVGYFIVRSLGVDAAFWDVLYAMVILQAIIYFSPSPGASGIAEIAAGSIMSYIIPTAHLLAFTILWRFCTSYAGILVGGVILSRDISESLSGLVQIKEKMVNA